MSFNTASGKYCCNWGKASEAVTGFSGPEFSFNTASGKYCCNQSKEGKNFFGVFSKVSIPQAVSTVATKAEHVFNGVLMFQYRKR